MGGYFCGGQNQTHGCTTEYKQLDSFHCGKSLPLMEQKGLEQYRTSLRWNDGGSIGVILYLDRLSVLYSGTYDGRREEIREAIYFDTVANNYGGPPRVYFLCPRCGRRCRMLYMHRLHFKCRQCARLNYYSQQVSHGTDEAAFKMRRFIREKFGVKEKLSPAEAECHWPARPKGMHQETYDRLRQELEQLQEQYSRAWIAQAAKICGIDFHTR